MFWNIVRTLQERARDLALIPACLFGFAFARRWSIWLTGFSLNGFVETSAFDVIVLVANPVALLACVVLVGTTGPLLRKGWLIVGSTVALVAGSAFALLPSPEPLAFAGSTLAIAGFGVMFLMWLELYGSLEPRKMVVAYFGSLVVHTLVYLLMQGFKGEVAPGVVLLLPLCSTCCLVAAVLKTGHQAPPPQAESAQDTRHSGVARRMFLDASMGRLLAWITVFGIAFGMGEAVTNLGTSGSASIAGRSAFALAMVASALFATRRFTLAILYRTAVPLMICGLAVSFFFNVNPWASQFLMSAGMEGYQALGLIVCCGIAMREKASAAGPCGIVFAVEALAIQLGKALMDAFGNLGLGSATAVGIFAILALVMATMFLFKESDLVSSYSEQALRTVQEDKRLARQLADFAAEHGLTDKEKSVFFLLASGKSSKDIADELYLASGTVRAHTSKIYQKLGVHSRAEFDELVKPFA